MTTTTDTAVKITFVNGESKCGCEMEFSDGEGQYSDVHTIKLCAHHDKSDLLRKVIAVGELTRVEHEELEAELCSVVMGQDND